MKKIVIYHDTAGMIIGNSYGTAVYFSEKQSAFHKDYFFSSLKQAKDFIVQSFSSQGVKIRDEFTYIELEIGSSNYVTVKDIITAGYSHCTENILMSMETNPTLH